MAHISKIMDIYKHFFKPYLRPIIYAGFITIGVTILIYLKSNALNSLFWISSSILYIIVLSELYFTSNHFHIIHKKNTKAVYDLESHRSIQFAHHLLMPSLYYFSIVYFTFSNNQPSLYLLIVLICFLSFIVLFENIHSFYHHKLSLNKSTGYIYDILGVLLVFLMIYDSIILIRNNFAENTLAQILILALVLTVNMTLLTLRNSITPKEILIALISLILLVGISIILLTNSVQAISIAFIIAILYRFYNLFVNFSIEHVIETDQLIEDLILLVLVATLLNLYMS